MDSQLAAELKDFISREYLFGDESRMPADSDSLLETGVLDSTGVLELIEFLEATYGIGIEEHETIPDNLGSVANILRFVTNKRLGHSAGVV